MRVITGTYEARYRVLYALRNGATTANECERAISVTDGAVVDAAATLRDLEADGLALLDPATYEWKIIGTQIDS